MTRDRLPQEAREGLERAWLAILRARHPGVDWQIVREEEPEDDAQDADDE